MQGKWDRDGIDGGAENSAGSRGRRRSGADVGFGNDIPRKHSAESLGGKCFGSQACHVNGIIAVANSLNANPKCRPRIQTLSAESGRRRYEYDALVRIFAMGDADRCDGVDRNLYRAGSRESGRAAFSGVIERLVE